MAQRNIKDLMTEGLQDIYDAEQQITQALPKMAQAASSQQLRQGFEQHLQETRGQIQRLEQAFQALGIQPQGRPCEAIRGMVQETEELLQQGLAPEVQDAGLIVSAQKVEHYEIAAYGSLRSLAQACGANDCANLFEQTLKEEKATDEKLTQLANSEVNPKAARAA
jgi:ferritin-like metal-binding protein YciE